MGNIDAVRISLDNYHTIEECAHAVAGPGGKKQGLQIIRPEFFCQAPADPRFVVSGGSV